MLAVPHPFLRRLAKPLAIALGVLSLLFLLQVSTHSARQRSRRISLPSLPGGSFGDSTGGFGAATECPAGILRSSNGHCHRSSLRIFF